MRDRLCTCGALPILWNLFVNNLMSIYDKNIFYIDIIYVTIQFYYGHIN